MRVGDFLGEDGKQGVLLFDPFRQGEVGGFRAMRDIGILLVGMEDQLIHVVKGHTQPRMPLAHLLQSPLDQFRVHQLPDEGGGHHGDIR